MGSDSNQIPRCTYRLARADICGERTVPGKEFCDKHYALRCAVCTKRQAKFACEEPIACGDFCSVPICSSICQEVHVPQAHKEVINLEEIAIHVTLADGSAQWFRVPTARLGGEIALIHPQTRKPCRCLYARTEKGVFYYAEATGRGRPQTSPAQMQQAAPQPSPQPVPQPAPSAQAHQPAPLVQKDTREEKKHGTNLLTAFSLHVGYLLSICEQNNPFIHEVLAAQSPDLRDRLEKVLTDVTIAILKERDG